MTGTRRSPQRRAFRKPRYEVTLLSRDLTSRLREVTNSASRAIPSVRAWTRVEPFPAAAKAPRDAEGIDLTIDETVGAQGGTPVATIPVETLAPTRFEHGGWVLAAAHSADGRVAVTGGSDGCVRTWDIATGCAARTLKTDAWTLALALSSDGELIAAGGANGVTMVWRRRDGENVARLRHDGPVCSVRFATHDRGRLLSTSADGTARLWDSESGRETARMTHPGVVRGAALAANGREVVTACSDGVARVWEDGTVVQRIETGRAICSVAFSGDGTSLLLASSDGTAALASTTTGTTASITTANELQPVWAVAVSDDAERFATAGADGVACVYDLDGVLRREFEHGTQIRALAFSPGRRVLLTGGVDGVSIGWPFGSEE